MLFLLLTTDAPIPSPANAEEERCRALICEHIEYIEHSCRRVCGLPGYYDGGDSGADILVDRLFLMAIERMSADGFRVIRQFSGRANIKTYLRTVISNIFIDLKRKDDGRKAPGAEPRISFREVPASALVRYDGDGGDGGSTFAGGVRIDAAGRIEIPDDSLSPERAFVDNRKESLKTELLTEIMELLEPEEKAIISMRYMDGLDVKDICAALGLKDKLVYKRIYSALAKGKQVILKKGVSIDEIL